MQLLTQRPSPDAPEHPRLPLLDAPPMPITAARSPTPPTATPAPASDSSALEAMKARAPEVAELLRSIATPTRLLLLCQIARGEPSVAELERDLGLRQPGLSQQLAELRRSRLVRTRRASRSIHYAIADARIHALLNALHAIYCSVEADPASPAGRLAPPTA